jgi:hypothetical protein
MGEEPRSVEERKKQDLKEQDPDERVEHLEEEIEETRERLGVYLTELDHRRHRIAKLIKRGGSLVLALVAVSIVAAKILPKQERDEEE